MKFWRVAYYLGILTSPKAPKEQKESILKKLKRGFDYKENYYYEFHMSIVRNKTMEVPPQSPNFKMCYLYINVPFFKFIFEIRPDGQKISVQLVRDDVVHEKSFEKYKKFRNFFKNLKMVISRINREVEKIISDIKDRKITLPKNPYQFSDRFKKYLRFLTFEEEYTMNIRLDLTTLNYRIEIIPKSSKAYGFGLRIRNSKEGLEINDLYEFLDEVGEADPKYVALSVDEYYWAYNEQFKFWRFRRRIESEDGKIRYYRTDKKPFDADSVEFERRGWVLALFEIKRITEKSIWIEPIQNLEKFIKWWALEAEAD